MMLKKYVGVKVKANSLKMLPDIKERSFWDGIPDEYKNLFIKSADEILDKPIEILPVCLYGEFTKSGNRSNFESPQRKRRSGMSDLVIAECFTNTGKYLGKAIDYMWAILEETMWCIPAHCGLPLPDVNNITVDLFAAETMASLSAAFYVLRPSLGEAEAYISAFIKKAFRERIYEPVMTKCFSWSGFSGNAINNWNPWINSNILFSALTVGDGEQKQKIVDFTLSSVDLFINSYGEDGGCDEGPSYWTVAAGAMHEYLEILYTATDGEVNIYGENKIKNMADYICKAHISNDYVMNFADAPAKMKMPGSSVYYFGGNTDNEAMVNMGILASKKINSGVNRLRSQLRTLCVISETKDKTGGYPYYETSVLHDIQVLAARDGKNDKGLYLAVKGGHNDESHNHNDVGSFIVYSDGKPCLVDPSMETYTKKTFSSQRYDLWTMQSGYHNIPIINGNMQKNGRQYAAKNPLFDIGKDYAAFSCDIEDAYQTGIIEKYKRKAVLKRHDSITVSDEFTAKEPLAVVQVFMTPCEHEISESEIIFRVDEGRDVKVRFDPLYEIKTEKIELDDASIASFWGKHIYRILLKTKEQKKEDKLIFTFKQM